MLKTTLLLLFCLIYYSGVTQKTIALTKARNKTIPYNLNDKHAYSLRLEKDGFARIELNQKGIDLIIYVYDPKKKLIDSIDSPTGENGLEVCTIMPKVSGNYQLIVTALPIIKNDSSEAIKTSLIKKNPVFYEITEINILNARDYQKKMIAEKQETENIIGWIKDNAIPVKTLNTGEGYEDLMPLKTILKDVECVGLGEATHGTGDFFKMKHRLVEFLVKELGFTVFAIEASYAGCQHINNYILYGIGKAETALPKQGFWTWDTQEVIAMIEWMKQYNEMQPFDTKIKFCGIDLQHNSKGGGIDFLESYLTKVDSAAAMEKKLMFETLRKNEIAKDRTPYMDSCRKDFETFIASLVKKSGVYVRNSSKTAYDSCLNYCKIIAQYLECYNQPRKPNWWLKPEQRDFYMASNFIDLQMQEKPGTKFIVWAHNGHVQKDANVSVNGGLNPLGSYLDRFYHEKYFVFGFSFNKGGIRVEDFNGVIKWQHVINYTVTTDAKEGLIDWYFAKTKLDKFIINFRQTSFPSFISSFIAAPRQMRFWGSGMRNDFIEKYYEEYTIAKSFDALIFFNEVQPSVPTKSGVR